MAGRKPTGKALSSTQRSELLRQRLRREGYVPLGDPWIRETVLGEIDRIKSEHNLPNRGAVIEFLVDYYRASEKEGGK